MDRSPRMPGSFYQELDGSYLTQPPTRTRLSGRKRPRIDCEYREFSQDASASTTGFELGSPSPLVNTSYRLAGGLDTPGTWSARREEYFNDADAVKDYRQNRFTVDQREGFSEGQNPQTPGTPTTREGWNLRRTAWALTGGLAGKFFNFCWNSTFRGFSAGGGMSYDMDIGTPEITNAAMTSSLPRKNDVFSSHYEAEFVPGSFSEVSTSPTLTMKNTSIAMPTQSQPDNRIDDSISRGNWVFVERRNDADDTSSPARKRSKASFAGSNTRREPSRKSTDTPLPAQSGASYASPRSRVTSAAHSHTRRSINAPSSPRNSTADSAQRSRIRQTLGSPPKRQSSVRDVHNSPISPEIESYRKKKKKDDRKQDESLRRLNDQLQDMIREGKEALGAKFEILDEDAHVDEGYFEDSR